MVTWSRVKVCFGTLLLILFGLGCVLIYGAWLTSRRGDEGRGRADLGTLGVELIGLSVGAAVLAAVLRRRLSRED